MKILISGGCGFVGSHLCDLYIGDGHTVLCLDNFSSGGLSNVKHLIDYKTFKLVKGDVCDTELLDRLVCGVDVVFHLAAQIHVDRSVVEPRLTFESNVIGTLNVLEAARLYDVGKVVFASSSEVYGSAQTVPIAETHPLEAAHPYGVSKVAADRLCYSYAKTYGLDIGVARCFNTYGPRQRDVGYGGVISIFTRRVLNGFPPVVFGDGRQTRDYLYVSDAVAAYDAMLKHRGVEPINFGCGKEVSILDLARMIIKLCGREDRLEPVFAGARLGEVDRLIADSSRARRLLGWEAKVGLHEGLVKFVDWYRSFGGEERVTL